MNSRGPDYQYIWKGLRDPVLPDSRRIDLRAAEHTWKHFVVASRHFPVGSRVNDLWLGRALCDRLRNAWNGTTAEIDRRKTLDEAGEKMGQSIREATDLPLVFVHVVIGSAGGKHGEHWLLPLKPAVRMIVKRSGSFATVKTCFPLDRKGWDSYRLWSSEIRRIVLRYSDRSQDQKCCLLPQGSKRVPRNSDGNKLIDTQIRFCDPCQWGFESADVGARWRPGGEPPTNESMRLKPRPR
jgi:hypothetical protein